MPKSLYSSVGSMGRFRFALVTSLYLFLNIHAHGYAASPKPSPKTLSPAAASLPSVVYDSYILGPGDSLRIELLEVPELSGQFMIGPDGILYLPRLRALAVEGLTVEELRQFLSIQYRTYVRNPEIFIQPTSFRPQRIYVGGEVKRPGFYTLSGGDGSYQKEEEQTTSSLTRNNSRFRVEWPTVFDAIQAAQGLTGFSDISRIEVTRKQPLSSGGGKISTTLNFSTLLSNGDESQNIRIYDGDFIYVTKSNSINREQLIQAGRTNLSPQFLQVFVSGRVKKPGAVSIPQGASLNQALIAAGGLQLLKGKIEFVRFLRDGEVDRRLFTYNPTATSGSQSNPILLSGDVINVQDSILSASTQLLNEFTGPFLGVFSIYNLFR